MKSDLSKIKLVVLDLDGTLYLGDEVIQGAREFVGKLEKAYKIVYLTNNSSKSRAEIREKLLKMGFACEPSQVYSSGYGAALYLAETRPESVFVIGERGLREELKQTGIRMVSEPQADVLLVGIDLNFSYKTLEMALQMLVNNCKFIACNLDSSFPSAGGQLKPGCGAMVAAIEFASGRKADYVIGKPNTYLLKKITGTYSVAAAETLVIGDSFATDIQMANDFKCPSFLLSSSGEADFSSILKDLLKS